MIDQHIEASAPEAANNPPPIYASFLTFTNLLDWLKGMDVIPTQIDRSLWGQKFSGSGGAQLFSGCRFLQLMEGERPRETLVNLAMAEEAERKPMIAAILREAYGAVFIDGLRSMTPKLVDEALRQLGTTDATHRKALSFFVNAAKFAEIPMPGAVAKRARNRPATKRGSGARSRGGTPTPRGNNDASTSKMETKTNVGSLDALRLRYVELLLNKVETDMDPDLLDRIESLLGFEPQDVDEDDGDDDLTQFSRAGGRLGIPRAGRPVWAWRSTFPPGKDISMLSHLWTAADWANPDRRAPLTLL